MTLGILPLLPWGQYPYYYYFRSGVTNTPRGGAANYMKILGKPFCSQRNLSAHPSPLEIGVLSSSMSVAPPSSYRVARLILT